MRVGVDTPKLATADAVATFAAPTPTQPSGADTDVTPAAGTNS
jgi:hypothetical protein